MKEANFRRKILIERDYLQYRDDIKVSERTKDIAADYVAGMSYKELFFCVPPWGVRARGLERQ